MFRADKVIFRENELLFRECKVKFREDRNLFREDEIKFRENKVIYREQGVKPLVLYTPLKWQSHWFIVLFELFRLLVG